MASMIQAIVKLSLRLDLGSVVELDAHSGHVDQGFRAMSITFSGPAPKLAAMVRNE